MRGEEHIPSNYPKKTQIDWEQLLNWQGAFNSDALFLIRGSVNFIVRDKNKEEATT
jgi:hypothetical protein